MSLTGFLCVCILSAKVNKIWLMNIVYYVSEKLLPEKKDNKECEMC